MNISRILDIIMSLEYAIFKLSSVSIKFYSSFLHFGYHIRNSDSRLEELLFTCVNPLVVRPAAWQMLNLSYCINYTSYERENNHFHRSMEFITQALTRRIIRFFILHRQSKSQENRWL